MSVENYAQIKSGSNLIINIIVAETSFTLSGFALVKINEGIFCQPATYYNESDGGFYDDDKFTTINGKLVNA
ncbi:hypothetical protein [Sodalis sp. RH20]|uniref:hypothetical protein n=1 Tax=unclassified Sodalis (in: enterobacteria) TaxID=2636512 RepID=UPI0039B5E578